METFYTVLHYYCQRWLEHKSGLALWFHATNSLKSNWSLQCNTGAFGMTLLIYSGTVLIYCGKVLIYCGTVGFCGGTFRPTWWTKRCLFQDTVAPLWKLFFSHFCLLLFSETNGQCQGYTRADRVVNIIHMNVTIVILQRHISTSHWQVKSDVCCAPCLTPAETWTAVEGGK